MKSRFTRLAFLFAAVSFAATPFVKIVSAQESKSAAPAHELAALLAEKKLDSIAAKLPTSADQYVAALYFPGQLLVISARYSAPAVLNEKLVRNEFRDVYIDLNAASIPESRVLVTDMGADGLKPRRVENQAFDLRDANGKAIRFDGNWREDKMSEQDYMKAFADADSAYASALNVLLARLKKGTS